MRTLKFRLWDDEEKKMYVPEKLNFDAEEGCMQAMFDNIHLMQFTGLLDKNGKEIYEGDIVEIVRDTDIKYTNSPHDEFPYAGRASVYYDDVNAGFYLRNEDDETSIGYYAGWHGWNWLSVIGNQYENPELLTQHNSEQI